MAMENKDLDFNNQVDMTFEDILGEDEDDLLLEESLVITEENEQEDGNILGVTSEDDSELLFEDSDDLSDMFDDIEILEKISLLRAKLKTDTYTQELNYDVLGIIPNTVLKEDDIETIGTCLGIYSIDMARRCISDLKEFGNHVATILVNNFPDEKHYEIYKTYMDKVKSIESKISELELLRTKEDFSESSMSFYFDAIVSNNLNLKQIEFIINSIVKGNNELSKLSDDSSDLTTRLSNYIKRDYEYSEEELQILKDLDFPDLFGMESEVKLLADIPSRTKRMESLVVENYSDELITNSRSVYKIINAYLCKDIDAMKYQLI